MLKIRVFIAPLIVAALAVCSAAHGQSAAAPIPEFVFAQDVSDLPADPAVRYGRLENGMRYAIMHNETPTDTAAVRLRFAAGSLMEDDDQLGLAHFLEHMAFNGSQNVPEGEMVRILERTGLAFGPDTNAYTSLEETVYQLDLPNTEETTIDTAFMLLREVADKLTIEPDAVDRERGVVLSEYRVNNTYVRRYRDAAQGFLFPGQRFVDRSPIGTPEILQTAPAERIRDFYEAYYRPERALLVFVGDAPVDEIETLIGQMFGDWAPAGPDGGEPPASEPIDAGRALAADFFADPDMSTAITAAVMRPAVEELDTVAARREDFIEGLGFSLLTRRFQRIARSADAPFISASSNASTFYDTVEVVSIDVTAQPDRWADALRAGEQELRRALEYGFHQAELDEVLADLRASMEASVAGAGTRSSPGLANSLTSNIGGDRVFTHPETSLQRFEDIVAEMTIEDVEAAFRDAWGEAEPQIFIGRNAAIDGGSEAILAAYSAARAEPVEAGDVREETVFAYDDFGAPGEVVAQEELDDLGMTLARFGNNVHLTVMPTTFREDRINVSVRVDGGRLMMPKELPGLEHFADSAFTAAGLGEHDIDSLQSALAGRNVGLSFSTGGDAFRFSATTRPEDLDLQMKVLAAFIADPGYREEALERYRRSLDTWYDSLDATPQGVASQHVSRLLRSGDPRYGIPPKEQLFERNLEELAAVLDEAFANSRIDIAIVGDVDIDAAIAATAASFGAMPPHGEEAGAFAEARVAVFPEQPDQPRVLHHQGERDRGLAMIYWPAVDDSDPQLSREIAMMREVMSLKLIERVREAEAATYSPSVSASLSGVSPGYGYIAVSLDIEPENIDRYFDVVDEIAAEMAAGEVSEDELDRARAPVLEQLEERLENNGYWTSLAVLAQLEPRYLDEHRTDAEGYAAVTREDVIAAAAQFLRSDTAYRIAVYPAPYND
ncbi:MAG: insulinase family protein [Maricaulaceae bacterium]|jgi:zinc protease